MTTITTTKSIIAGGITGGVEALVTFPTEYVKTQLQLDGGGGGGNRRAGTVKRYSGIIDCIKQTVRTHGFFGLYRGASVLLYGSVPKSTVRFVSFEALKRRLADADDAAAGRLSGGNKFLCGLGAGVAMAVFAVTPIETLKVKFINDQTRAQPQFRGFFHGVRTIVKSEGLAGCYQGLGPTILKNGSNQAIRFWVLLTLQDLYRGGDEKKRVPKLWTGLFGAAAGAASAFANMPVDVVKTRMQGLEAAEYKNSFHCARLVLRRQGPKAFYKGTVPRLSKVCIEVALTFVVYESVVDLLNQMGVG